jgi:hypothetical protein
MIASNNHASSTPTLLSTGRPDAPLRSSTQQPDPPPYTRRTADPEEHTSEGPLSRAMKQRSVGACERYRAVAGSSDAQFRSHGRCTAARLLGARGGEQARSTQHSNELHATGASFPTTSIGTSVKPLGAPINVRQSVRAVSLGSRVTTTFLLAFEEPPLTFRPQPARNAPGHPTALRSRIPENPSVEATTSFHQLDRFVLTRNSISAAS